MERTSWILSTLLQFVYFAHCWTAADIQAAMVEWFSVLRLTGTSQDYVDNIRHGEFTIE